MSRQSIEEYIRKELENELLVSDDSPACSTDLKFVNVSNKNEFIKTHSLIIEFTPECAQARKLLSEYDLTEHFNVIELESEIYHIVKEEIESDSNEEAFEQSCLEIFKAVQKMNSESDMNEEIGSAIHELVKKTSDISITIQDPGNGKEKTYHLHKLFMKRCQYIASVLNSGMIESKSNEMTFNIISIEAFEKVLEYVYTDIFSPTLENCVEVYLFANFVNLFSLSDLIYAFIKKKVIETKSEQMAIDLLSIPDFANDISMRELCLRFLKISRESALVISLNLEPAQLKDNILITRISYLLAEQYELIKDRYFDLPIQIRDCVQKQVKLRLKNELKTR